MSPTGKRIKTYLLIGIGILLAFQWPRGPGNTAATDILLVVAIIFGWLSAWKHRQPFRFPLIVPQWLILLAGLTATAVSVDQTASLATLGIDIYIYLWFLSLVNIIDNEADLRKMRKAWAVAACLQGLLIVLATMGIGRTLFVMPLKIKHVPIPGTEGQSGRATGTIGHPNLTGAYMMTSLFVFLLVGSPRKTWQRVLLGFLLFAGVFLTGSNADIIACLIGMFVVLAYRIARSSGKTPLVLGPVAASLAAAACLVAIIAIVGIPPSIIDATKDTFLQYSLGRLVGASVFTRAHILTEGWKAYRGHPLGIGPNAFSTWTGAGSMHNDFVSHLVERGPLGFIGLLLLCVEVFFWVKSSMELTAGTPEKQFEVVVLGAGLLSSFLAGLAYEVMHWRHHWLLITLVFVQYKLLRFPAKDTLVAVRARYGRLSSRSRT